MSIFGFPIKTPGGGGDFLPILKYDARAGRLFRIDSVNTGNGWDRVPHDITTTFKALIDLRPGHVEVGWIDFATGGQPSFVMVPYPGHSMPPQPGPNHKHGLRFALKLAKDCAGDAPVRQIAGTSASFLNGMEALVTAYNAGAAANPGKLPAIMLESALPVTSGSGQRSSTNYQPVFKIVGWAPPPADLPGAINMPVAQDVSLTKQGHTNGAAPATGATRAAPPAQQQAAVSADEFG